MEKSILLSGYGGQGIMVMGALIAYAGIYDKKNVSWFPSYGPEMRGGTANCTVVVSEKGIASPLKTSVQAVIAMNEPSLHKFEKVAKTGGAIFINESLINTLPLRDDIKVISIPCNEIAEKAGSLKAANMVMLGAVIDATRIVSMEAVIKSLPKAFSARNHHIIPINEEALRQGTNSYRIINDVRDPDIKIKMIK